MKRVIRNNVFETNSSSTHAICISKNHTFDKSKLPKNVYFEHGDFGWDVDKHVGCRKKASYLYQAISQIYKNNERTEKLKHIENVLNKYGIECDFEIVDEKDAWDYGYIDHCNKEELSEWIDNMMNDDDTLMTYLFGDAFVVTGNDNSYGFSEIMYEKLGNKVTEWGVYPEYGEYKEEYDNYDIYYKGN